MAMHAGWHAGGDAPQYAQRHAHDMVQAEQGVSVSEQSKRAAVNGTAASAQSRASRREVVDA
ncbi:MAG: hypothetical protein DI635_07105 [Pseudoxanthomonas suwonensis]|nr:MAG: hypothetical protein DI635_07105 [Pseudoxanthomonas suwonensis]